VEENMNERIALYFYDIMADFEFSTAVCILCFYLGFYNDTFSIPSEPIKSLNYVYYVPEMDIDRIMKIGT
jgi:hypothetical protein